MKFRYQRYQRRNPSGIPVGAPLDRPIIPAWLVNGPHRTKIWGLLDTGADITLLPAILAGRLRVSLESGAGVSSGVGGKLAIRFGTVQFEVSDDIEACSWSARVAFAQSNAQAVFGQRGFLEYFDTTFRGADHLIVMDPNSAFPRST